jgi:hypothetical protein
MLTLALAYAHYNFQILFPPQPQNALKEMK